MMRPRRRQDFDIFCTSTSRPQSIFSFSEVVSNLKAFQRSSAESSPKKPHQFFWKTVHHVENHCRRSAHERPTTSRILQRIEEAKLPRDRRTSDRPQEL